MAGFTIHCSATVSAIVAVLVLACSGCAPSEEQKALAAIKQLGGKIKSAQQGQVVEVDLSRTKATDDDLAAHKALVHNRSLNCSYTPITGQGLEQLAGSRDLQTLFLVGSELNDTGLAEVSKLSSLRTLHLGRTKITNAGLAELASMSNLRTLSLGNTQITDAGLAALKPMHELGTLVLRQTKTSPAGVQQLRQSLSKTQIER